MRLNFLILCGLLTLSSCTFQKAELGSEKNPVKIYFVPSVDARVIESSSKVFKDWLEKNTPYKYEISIPQSYIAVVEAFGSNQADVAQINTFGYLLAHEKYGAQAGITVVRHGDSTYKGQIIAKADSSIKSIKDLEGKKIAYVDSSSTSGFLLPKKLLQDKGVKPGQEIFAMKHDAVVSMVYQGQVEAGATFYSPEHNGELQDARRLVKTQYPDVAKKIKILELTEAIPNDPIVFRKQMPDEMKKVLSEAFMKFVATPEGKEAFNKVYGVTDLKIATDADYDAVRKMLKDLNKSVDQLMKK